MTKRISLFVVLSANLILSACGGGSGSGGGTAAEYVSINGTRYAEDGSNVLVGGYLDQTSSDAYQYGGQTGFVWMYDAQSGNTMSLQFASTADGWPGTYNFVAFSTGTYAMVRDPSISANAIMLPNGSGTGGSITIGSFGNIGQPITGSFNANLCDMYSACSTGIKNYAGTFSAVRIANYGSLANPASLFPSATPGTWTEGISPVTGKNYCVISGTSLAGTLTLSLAPSVDVNMAVFTDAGFTSPATCNVTSHLNVAGNGMETCAITVAANQDIYMTVSQATAATVPETYDLTVSKN